mmetsp:Transcript_49245/g.86683  ORF Transcript_49245/g.86683 Transcript_49245/m.86683 type:complete len:124 (-) Transcript_49245:181-552(-)
MLYLAQLCFLLARFNSSCFEWRFTAPDPVHSLNTTAYLGRWYQVYASFLMKYSIELGSNCATLDYSAVAGRPDEITVVHTQQFFGKTVQVSGYAVADREDAGIFDFTFWPFGPSEGFLVRTYS